MLSILLKLLHVQVTGATKIVHASVALRGGINGWWALPLGIAALLVVGFLYHTSRRYVGILQRLLLTLLRVSFLLALFTILLRPVLSLTLEDSVRRTIVILVDTSKSMSLAEKRDQTDDLKRVAIAQGILEPDKGLGQALPAGVHGLSEVPRMDLLKTSLRNSKLDLLAHLAQDYDIRTYSFPASDGAARIVEGKACTAGQATSQATTQPAVDLPPLRQWVEELKPEASTTPMGDALREVIARTRGQSLAGIVLLTDGGSNSGSDPAAAAQLAAQEPGGLPIFCYGVGTRSKDIIVTTLDAAPTVFAKDEVPAFVHVRALNLDGETGLLKLMLGGKVVASQEVRFTDNNEQVIAMKFTPQTQGEFDLVAGIDPRPDEITADNNFTPPQRIKVIEGKIRVLLIDQTPRWEFKYLQEQLQHGTLKGEKAKQNTGSGGPPSRVELKCLLVDADPGIALPGPGGEPSPYLARFPQTKEELINNFDVVILGDVDPKVFSTEQLDNLADFVSVFGGGLIMIAGHQHSPSQYLKTKIRDLLPVVLESRGIPGVSGRESAVADKPIKLELTRKGRDDPMLRLAADDRQNVEKWRQLPPIYWEYRVGAPKTAAEVLLADPDPAKATRFGKMPVVALQGYGAGQVLWVGTDNTWRWRQNKGDEFYLTLWSQMIQRLAQTHLLGAAKRTRIELDKDVYTLGDRVTVTAHLFDNLYRPLPDETVIGHAVRAAETNLNDVPLKRQPDGIYRGEFIAAEIGAFKFHVETPGDPEQKKSFTVVEPTTEVGDTNLNEVLLRQIAQTTGGDYFREETLYKLPGELRGKVDRIPTQTEAELAPTWFFFLLLLVLVTTEWVVRKLCQLK